MSSKKKSATPKAPEPRYANGNKVFILCFAFAGPGMILEGEVVRVETAKCPVTNDNGKIVGTETFYSYLIRTAKGDFDVNQYAAYPSYFEAAKVFAKSFLTLLK